MDEKDRAQLAEVLALVRKIDAELERFRPVLNLFAPNGHGTDIQRAGVLRTMRRAAKERPR